MKALAEEADSTAFKFNRIAEAENRKLADAERDAAKKVADAGKEAAANFPVPATGETLNDDEVQKARLTSAEVIKALALAADRVHRATADATMVIQEAADEAALAMKKPPPRPKD